MSNLEDRVEQIIGQRPQQNSHMAKGCVGDIRRLDFADGLSLVAKLGAPASGLDTEGRMLTYLREHTDAPVPDVLHASDDLLLMTRIEGVAAQSDPPEIHAGNIIAALHNITADSFGLEFDTLIGGLHQPNTQTTSWLEFFRDQRLLYMAAQARDAGKLPGDIYDRVETLAAHLDEFLPASSVPSLIHGDLWGGNILTQTGQVTGLIDPAIYYADPEIELAFSTMFDTFGDLFFACYQRHRPIDPDFFKTRRDLYNLYPLLVHAHLYGGSYVGSVDLTLKKFGA